MYWMTLPLKRYAEFGGRSRRMEYWMFSLLWLIILLVFGLLANLFGSGPDAEPPGFLVALMGLLMLGMFLPGLAVTIRRLHDQDRSGWFILIAFIPLIGSLILLVFMVLPGTSGDNRFGPDPKLEDQAVMAS